MRTSGLGEKRGSSTSGVLPIDSTTLPKRPPQGLLSSWSRGIVVPVTSKSIARELGAGVDAASLRIVVAGSIFAGVQSPWIGGRFDQQDPANRIRRGSPRRCRLCRRGGLRKQQPQQLDPGQGRGGKPRGGVPHSLSPV